MKATWNPTSIIIILFILPFTQLVLFSGTSAQDSTVQESHIGCRGLKNNNAGLEQSNLRHLILPSNHRNLHPHLPPLLRALLLFWHVASCTCYVLWILEARGAVHDEESNERKILWEIGDWGKCLTEHVLSRDDVCMS